MEIEIFTLCDYAQDYSGKLLVVGTFDVITSQNFPCVHPSCSIAGRLRFSEKEVGPHELKLRLTNSSDLDIVPPIEGQIQINKPEVGNYSTINFAITMGQLKFESAGKYSIQLYIDNDWKSGLTIMLHKI